MITLLLASCLLGSLWFLWVVQAVKDPPAAGFRRAQTGSARAHPTTPDACQFDDHAASPWTALDDHQLDRLLRGSSS